MQGNNRGGVSNIAKTAAKLPPFAFNDARLACAPPLRHLMQTHVRGVPRSKQLPAAVEEACQRERRHLCDVCRRPYPASAAADSSAPRMCPSCAQWAVVDDVSDTEACSGPGPVEDVGARLAWLSGAMPKLELG